MNIYFVVDLSEWLV